MPKRVAETPLSQQISDTTGSGPFIFKKDEWKPGDKTVYVKNPKYKPRSEPPSGLAGGKVAKVDRVEWVAMSDQQTVVNALINGEIDMIESVPNDLMPLLEKDKGITLIKGSVGNQYVFRMNWLTPPFNNPKLRQLRQRITVRYHLPPKALVDLIDARSFDLYDEPMVSLAEFERYATRTSSALIDLAARILNDGKEPNVV